MLNPVEGDDRNFVHDKTTLVQNVLFPKCIAIGFLHFDRIPKPIAKKAKDKNQAENPDKKDLNPKSQNHPTRQKSTAQNPDLDKTFFQIAFGNRMKFHFRMLGERIDLYFRVGEFFHFVANQGMFKQVLLWIDSIANSNNAYLHIHKLRQVRHLDGFPCRGGPFVEIFAIDLVDLGKVVHVRDKN